MPPPEVVVRLVARDGRYRAEVAGNVFGWATAPAQLAGALQAVLAQIGAPRVVFDTDEASATVWWERLIALPGSAIVRRSRAVPAIRSLPLAPPVRVLSLDSMMTSTDIEALAMELGQDNADGPLLVGASMAAGDALQMVRRLRWPTADIVHIGIASPEDRSWSMRLSEVERVRSLGWLERAVRGLQTRLLLLEADDDNHESVLAVAHRLADRGGPAIVILSPEVAIAPLLRRVVEGATVDHALDDAPGAAAFLGHGRERLVQLWNTVDELAAGDDFLSEGWFELQADADRVDMLSCAGRLRELARWVEQAPAPEPPVAGPRYVNIDLLRMRGDALEQVPARDGGPLTVDEHLCIRVAIGPFDVELPELRRRALIEEVILWDPESGGAWLSVGIAGVDCDIEAAPEQPLWLPREGVTAPCYFTVRPRAGGLVAVRITVYQGNNVLQSFRLVARCQDGERGPADDEAFARALDVHISEVAGLIWAYRLDFALSPTLDPAARSELPRRALSLVVNELAAKVLVSVKGDELFTAREGGALWNYVDDARKALGRWSEQADHYPFDPEAGELTDVLVRALRALATQGRLLRNEVIPLDAETRLEVERIVASTVDDVIQVAHVARHQIVPWALLYEFELDTGREEIGGRPAIHDVCLAGLPSPAGTLPYPTCGTAPGCLLAPDGRGPVESADGGGMLDRRTVVCPLGFWGFRHTIEMPPKATRHDDPVPVWREVGPSRPVRVAAALDPNLPRLAEQSAQLEALLTGALPVSLATPTTRDDLIDALRETDLQVIYLYCHAAGEPRPPSSSLLVETVHRPPSTRPPSRAGRDIAGRFIPSSF